MTTKEKVSKVLKLNIDARKYYKLTVNRADECLFLLPPPSFYAIVSGAFIGTATNLLIGLLFTQEVAIDTTLVKLAILSIFLSSACSGYISLVLEQLRSEVIGDSKITKREKLREEITARRTKLWPSAIGGFTTIIIGICFMYCATTS